MALAVRAKNHDDVFEAVKSLACLFWKEQILSLLRSHPQIVNPASYDGGQARIVASSSIAFASFPGLWTASSAWRSQLNLPSSDSHPSYGKVLQ